ncbi:aminopeptidase P family protein [Flavobacteriales bacterium]|nr:aminopeptidase P family protein [Flavobacteriales bacterium]
MKYKAISKELFEENRKKFCASMTENSIAVFCSNDQMPTNSDGTMPFKQNSDLFWLSGVDQEESKLVLFPDSSNPNHREVLFLKETSELIAIWEGAKLTKEQAFQTSGVRTVYWNSEFEKVFADLMAEAKNVFYNSNEHSRASSKVETQTDRFNNWCKSTYSDKNYVKSAPILHELRSVKHQIEIDLLQHACNITEKGFRRVLDFVKPGVMEYEIEAEFMHEFLINRSKGFAYEPIIASGRNACVLHYIDNNQECKDGDVILMDVGAEYANYASDMTRCIPVSGRFSKRQKDVYNAVLRVMKEATNMLVPGTMLNDYHKEVGKVMQSELLALGLLDQNDIDKQDPKNPAYRKYFMHGTSHFLGLDVHDVGHWDTPIKEGMVFTCEPGIYILEENLGIRLENDLVITNDKPLDLMANIPLEADAIEDLMN